MLYLLGRCSSLIIEKDTIISQFIVEQQLSQVKGVNIGTMIYVKGEKFIFIELQKGYLEKEVKHQIDGLDIDYHEVKFIDKMPRDPRHFSKIEYKKLG